jgi:hypothetical protein
VNSRTSTGGSGAAEGSGAASPGRTGRRRDGRCGRAGEFHGPDGADVPREPESAACHLAADGSPSRCGSTRPVPGPAQGLHMAVCHKRPSRPERHSTRYVT